MTAPASSPVCFSGGTVLYVFRVLHVFYVLLSAPPPLAEDTEDVEDVEDGEDSGRRRNPPKTQNQTPAPTPNHSCAQAGWGWPRQRCLPPTININMKLNAET